MENEETYFDGLKILSDAAERYNMTVKLNLGDIKKLISIIHETGIYKCRMEYIKSKLKCENPTIRLFIYTDNGSQYLAVLEYKLYPEQVLESFKLYNNVGKSDLMEHLIAALVVY
jgi:hypothetical protein